MTDAIHDGYLCPIRAQMIPLKLDIGEVGISNGDFSVSDIGHALDPYLEQIAEEMAVYCRGRKTLVFLPLISTSQRFCSMLNASGLKAAEVNGYSEDRAEILADFDAGKYDVLCNSMLLTEGWDCPSVDCIVVLRPTKIRSLYQQMVGRGMRLHPGNRDHVPYDVWERQGYLQTTEGNVVHYGYIEKFIERLGERFNIREIAFDRWGAVQMVQNLEGMGFTVVPFGQGFKDMSPPTKELMKLVLEQRIAHAGHPVLRWMMDNIYVRTDPAGNIKPDKEKSTEKIDGAVATIMALDRAIRCGNGTGESVYDTRGILFL